MNSATSQLKSYCWLHMLAAALLLALAGCHHEAAMPSSHKHAPATMGDGVQTLPPGAIAKWVDSADAPLAEDGTSPNTTLFVRGADKEPIHVVIKAKARFGSLSEPLLELEGDLAPQEELLLPLDLRSTLALHAKQYDYATRIKASVWFVSAEKTSSVRQRLEERYIVLSKAGDSPQIVCIETLHAKYPWGITSSEELESAQEGLPRIPIRDGALSGIEPGVYASDKELPGDN